ncbi:MULTISPECIES: class I SAM-dependent methyltransferase [unclassified Roseobacter]|uniref:class I SAM-dependent methyltransferase n=3 Tax=unclassified Roseobacter TaxID=196798 RepID=UPI00209C3784|nr:MULTISPECIES: class I SAM-dependent methyltransferase [unclassified Roseobacter]
MRDMHHMAGLLLAECVPEDGHVLVLGAGGGLELDTFAQMHPAWQFTGVDPSADMIAQARNTLGDRARNVSFVEGYIDDAPSGPFDGAACLLTLHFLEQAERLRSLRELRRRLRPGAPFVVAHHSFPQKVPERDLWLRRNADLLISWGLDAVKAEKGIETMKSHLPTLSPEEDEALFVEAGFTSVQLFYAGFTFKGWVCTAN